MPATTNSPGQAIAGSFLGLQSYTEAQSNLFFGRDAETDTLTRLIDLNTLTIVFGRSGTGKTSLLNAGVFPRLRKSFCLPFRIRLEFNDNSPDLISQVKKVLKEEIDKYGFKADGYPSSETLWEYFHKEPLWKTVTPILVFDQFEEIFTLAKSNPRFASLELPLFWEELSNLIENNIPEKLKEKFLEQKENVGYNYKKQKAKVVFSFREEYLPEFETIAAKIPSLKYSRFRLLPMNGNQAYEVITKTWKENISAKEAHHLVSYFTNEPGIDDHSFVTVEPSLLSQVCAYIDKERIESGGGKVSAELLNKYPKETILRSIYNEAIIAADSSLHLPGEKEASKNLIKIFVEEKLITSEGYRTRYNLSADDEVLKPGIMALTAKYFIREDDNVVELTHDVLAPIIKSDREKRRTEIALAAARKRARKKAIILIIGSLLIAGIVFAIFSIASANAFKAMEKSLAKKDAADSAVSVLNKKIEVLRLDSIRLAGSKNGSDTVIKHQPDTTGGNIPDHVLEDSIFRLTNQLALLENEITSIKGELKRKDSRLNDINIENQKIKSDATSQADALQKTINDLYKRIEQYKNDSIKSSTRIRELETTIINLRGQIRKLGETIQELMNRNPGRINSNLRIQVYDKSGPERIPITKDTFAVYIIPLNNKNKAVLEKNRSTLYSKDCNEFDKMRGDLVQVQKAYFENGYYYPANVLPNGRYKIKICNILDGYFDLKLPSSSGSVFWKLAPRDKVEIKLGRF